MTQPEPNPRVYPTNSPAYSKEHCWIQTESSSGTVFDVDDFGAWVENASSAVGNLSEELPSVEVVIRMAEDPLRESFN